MSSRLVLLYLGLSVCLAGTLASALESSAPEPGIPFLVCVALGFLFIIVLGTLSYRAPGGAFKRVGRAFVPVVVAIVGLVLPAIGYFALIGGHPRTLSDWPWWAIVCIPASALFYGDVGSMSFAAIAFFNVAAWVAVVVGIARLIRLTPPEAAEWTAA